MRGTGLFKSSIGAALAAVLAMAPKASAQFKPWELFLDSASTSACDVINASNAELVLLSSTSQLRIVSGTDVTLEDSFVDADGFVFLEGNPVGVIDFATDGDGLRTVWWMSLTGTVVDVNGFTGEPTQTDEFPSDFVDVPCDACAFWDDPAACEVPDPGPTLPPISVRLCGTNLVLPFGLTASSLMTLSLVHRRRTMGRRQGLEPSTIAAMD